MKKLSPAATIFFAVLGILAGSFLFDLMDKLF